MARIRSLHPGQWFDEEFVSCTFPARLLALALRSMADDQGVFEWKPVQIKMQALPADTIEVGPLLEELLGNNQIQRFESGGKAYGAIRNFRKWQRPEKPKVVHPLPANLRRYVGLPPFGDERDAEQSATGGEDGGSQSATDATTAADGSATDTAAQADQSAIDTLPRSVQSANDSTPDGDQSANGTLPLDVQSPTSRRHIAEGSPNCSAEEGGRRKEVKRTATQSRPPKELGEMVAVWNEVCGDVLPRAQDDISDSRQSKLRLRLADRMGGSIDTWRAFCQRVRAAPHLIGGTNGDWRASLDWCLEPKNMDKVLEGNYDRAAPAAARTPGQSYAGNL